MHGVTKGGKHFKDTPNLGTSKWLLNGKLEHNPMVLTLVYIAAGQNNNVLLSNEILIKNIKNKKHNGKNSRFS